MVVEAHVRYLRELKLEDPVRVTVQLLGYDAKRIHLFEELRHATGNWVSATSESMTLCVDMTAKKVAPFTTASCACSAPYEPRTRYRPARTAPAAASGCRTSADACLSPQRGDSIPEAMHMYWIAVRVDMSASAEQSPSLRRTAVLIREHRIPSANSAPYICVEGPDRNLWFCESGAAKIGCFDPRERAFQRIFSLPTPGATPIGIALGADRQSVVRAEKGQ